MEKNTSFYTAPPFLMVNVITHPPAPPVQNSPKQASPRALQALSPLSHVWQAAPRAVLAALVDLVPSQVWWPRVGSRHPPQKHGMMAGCCWDLRDLLEFKSFDTSEWRRPFFRKKTCIYKNTVESRLVYVLSVCVKYKKSYKERHKRIKQKIYLGPCWSRSKGSI